MEIVIVADGGDPGTLPETTPAGVALRVLTRPGAARGDATCRDLGIMQARYGSVLTLDGHCDVPANDWARYLAGWAEANPQCIGCCVCVGLDDARPTPPSWKNKPRYHGARIELCGHDGAGWRVFCDKWLSDPALVKAARFAPRPIPSPLGGAYVLRRSWYVDGLRRPWAGMSGWGGLEVTLALVNALAGGKTMLLPVEVGHYFRSKSPYTTAAADILFNQLRLLHILPMPDRLRDVLTVWLIRNNPALSGMPFLAAKAALSANLEWLRLRRDDGWSKLVEQFQLAAAAVHA
jgi:hypothetical protein